MSSGRSEGCALPEPTYPLTIDTISKLIDAKMLVSMFCPSCGRHAQIDLEKVAAKMGRTWNFINRPWPVKCASCANSKVETPELPPISNPLGSSISPK